MMETRDNLSSRVVLTEMTPGRDAEFAAMLEEFRAAGESHVYLGDLAIAWQGYAAFYDLISRMKSGGYPRPEYVPMDAYFIEAGGVMLGEIYIRHRLTPPLEQMGGHIGYKVRPGFRNRGVATAGLKLALGKLAAMGVERALVTCNTTNAASATVIEKCGGMRIEDAHPPDRVERRYWIQTNADSVSAPTTRAPAFSL
jgi:predicted acetyltransferase